MAISAVITGDLVGSTKLSKTQSAKLLKNLTLLLSPFPHEFFRGDSFQVYIKSAEEAFPLLLKLRITAMKSVSPASDIRAGIGLGLVKTTVKSIRTATDEAFVLSGRMLEQLKEPQRLIIASNEKNSTVNTGLQLIALFTDYIFERLTVKQAEVVHEMLLQKTQTEAAKSLKKSQATINKHARAAGWPEMEKIILSYQSLVKSLLP